ncbi:hypothetical protein HDU98_006797 [Podochytrium sp. JEL0797]|nr:hypothetical protein HDU98_006797 [Podochytrium sp. JEL0797]
MQTNNSDIKSVCIFCGSSKGTSPVYMEAAKEFAKLLAERDVKVVYGGGSNGLMGQVAASALENGGKVLGIIPEAIASAKGFKGDRVAGEYTLHGETVIVKDMHTRKALMNEVSNAFVALPGGLGTFEEILEILTWSQLSIHSKPIVILNTNGFYEPLKLMLAQAVREGFMKEGNSKLGVFADTPQQAVDALFSYVLPSDRFALAWTDPSKMI